MSDKWTSLKTKLVKQGVLDEFFLQSVDTIILKSNDDTFKIPDDAYFPLLIEKHLRDVSAHLDRIVSYRREMRELEILSVRAGADYVLQRDQSKAEYDLACIRLRKSQSETERNGQLKAIESFGNDVNGVGAGLREIAVGAAARLANDLSDIQAEQALLTAMQDRLREYQDEYWQRHNEPGNAHNYKERAGIMLELLLQDKLFAERKCHALNLGFKAVYGQEPQIPLKQNASVDSLVKWVRALYEDIAIETRLESQFDLVLPLVQILEFNGGLVSAKVFNDAVKKCNGKSEEFLVSFDLGPQYFVGMANPRITAIGVSYGTRVSVTDIGIDRTATYESYCRYRGQVIPPVQSVGSVEYKRPPIKLGQISVYGSPVDYSNGDEVCNLNPIGKWSIKIKPRATYKSELDVMPSMGADENTAWVDIKLHLRLRAR